MSDSAEKVAPMPRLDRAVSYMVGKALVWLGKRAYDRGDMSNYNAALAALRAGDTTPLPPGEVCVCGRSRPVGGRCVCGCVATPISPGRSSDD